MGFSASTLLGGQGQGELGDKDSSEDDVHTERKMEEGSQTINKIRWADLMFSLQSVAKLQRAATRARIEVRQKGREASFKRQDVWVRDAKFMGEIQRLDAQGKLKGFEELSRLATECQAARDLLGPLEQENIEAESRWQGQVWRLREAEEDLYTEFEDEFRVAKEYSVAHGGEATSSYSSSSDYGSKASHVESREEQTVQIEADDVLLIMPDDPAAQESLRSELRNTDAQELENVSSASDLDSGIGDIDSVLGFPPFAVSHSGSAIEEFPSKSKYGSYQTPAKHRYAGIELYPELLEDFSTRRERISKWLQNTALESRLEGVTLFSILQDLLAKEDQNVPSNWSQLVIAYWELDEASSPRSPRENKDMVKQSSPVDDRKLAKVEPTNQYNGALTATYSDLYVESNISPADRINKASINSKKSTYNLEDTAIASQAPPATTPPSPPHSHPNSRPASCDIRTQGRPP
ncbi:hypothetical protein BDZ45DRAFT_371572 [Acephala macrosclerotiorum]|nr:hypothetical protein BDZ45DRAFT_371572 [Acephala macrosclerotiorum]